MIAMIRRASLALVAPLVLAAAGCGGGSSSPSTTAAPVTRITAPTTPPATPAYVTKANAVCRVYEARVLKTQPPTVFLGHDASDARAIARDRAAEAALARHLAAVKVPPGPAHARYLAMVAAVRRIVADEDRIVARLRAHRDGAANRVSLDVPDRLAIEAHAERRLGLDVCFDPGS